MHHIWLKTLYHPEMGSAIYVNVDLLCTIKNGQVGQSVSVASPSWDKDTSEVDSHMMLLLYYSKKNRAWIYVGLVKS